MLEENLWKILEFGLWLCRKPSAGLISVKTSGVQFAAAASIYYEAGTGSSSAAAR